jgi:hypothetical protein
MMTKMKKRRRKKKMTKTSRYIRFLKEEKGRKRDTGSCGSLHKNKLNG